MNKSFRIRSAAMADFDGLCALFEELDEHHRRARPDLFRRPAGHPRERGFVAGLIEDPDSTILVAETGDRALRGCATVIVRTLPPSIVRDRRRVAEIDNIVVARSARRLGIGRALLRAAEDWAARKAVPSLELSVYAFNEGPIAFYEASGFMPIIHRLGRSLPTSAAS